MGQKLQRERMATATAPTKRPRAKTFDNEGDEIPEVFGQRPPALRGAVPPVGFEGEESNISGRQAFRDRYLAKLSSCGAWAPRGSRTANHHTVTVFDWDDTILCTSYITQNTPFGIHGKLRKIAASARDLLETALNAGDVLILTNGIEGWVQQSAARFLPSLVPLLSRVHIVSARSRFERHFPGCVAEWKVQALLELKQLFGGDVANLISIGDSEHDLEAVRSMGRQFPHAAVKTVKMWAAPSPKEVQDQLKYLLRDYQSILNHAGDAHVEFRRPAAAPVADACGRAPPAVRMM